ncbi:hypothetical protein K2P97_12740 [bacterium]|nr:hypothetical protein [bacterium]
MKKLIASITLLLSISAQSSTLEPLLGLAVNSGTVKIRVSSGGCTTKASFEVKKITDAKKQAVQLFFVRVASDSCEQSNFDAYLPNGVVLYYSFDELGIMRGQNVYVGNPFGR